MNAEIKPRIDLEGRTRLETVIPLSTPYLVFLDPCDICNGGCWFCPSGDPAFVKTFRKPQLMDFDLYKKIIDDLATMPEPIKTLRLYADGEPLLNPQFPEMARYAKNTGRFISIDSTTNGLLIDQKLTQRLSVSGLDKIFISVPQGYNQEYIDNVRYLYLQSPVGFKIYIKIIGDGMDPGAIKKFYDDFGNYSDRIFVESLINCWPGFDAVPDPPSVGIYGNPLTKTNICPYLFYSLKINSDGTVSLCFLDYRHEMYLGDLKYESFKGIWNGVLLRNIRMDHLRGYRMKVSTNCVNCKQLIYGAPDILDPYASELVKKI